MNEDTPETRVHSREKSFCSTSGRSLWGRPSVVEKKKGYLNSFEVSKYGNFIVPRVWTQIWTPVLHYNVFDSHPLPFNITPTPYPSYHTVYRKFLRFQQITLSGVGCTVLHKALRKGLVVGLLPNRQGRRVETKTYLFYAFSVRITLGRVCLILRQQNHGNVGSYLETVSFNNLNTTWCPEGSWWFNSSFPQCLRPSYSRLRPGLETTVQSLDEDSVTLGVCLLKSLEPKQVCQKGLMDSPNESPNIIFCSLRSIIFVQY